MTYESLASNRSHGFEPTDSDSRLIKAHIQNLRSKLGDTADNPRYIANVYGTGYKFLPQVNTGDAVMLENPK